MCRGCQDRIEPRDESNHTRVTRGTLRRRVTSGYIYNSGVIKLLHISVKAIQFFLILCLSSMLSLVSILLLEVTAHSKSRYQCFIFLCIHLVSFRKLLLNSCRKVLGTDEKQNGAEKERSELTIGIQRKRSTMYGL